MARRRLHPLLYGVALFGLVVIVNVLSGRLADVQTTSDYYEKDLDSPKCRPFCSSDTAGAVGRMAVDLQTQDIAYEKSSGVVTMISDDVGEDWGTDDPAPQTANGMLKVFVERLYVEDKGLMKTTPAPRIAKNSIMKVQYLEDRTPFTPIAAATIPPFTMRPMFQPSTTPKPFVQKSNIETKPEDETKPEREPPLTQELQSKPAIAKESQITQSPPEILNMQKVIETEHLLREIYLNRRLTIAPVQESQAKAEPTKFSWFEPNQKIFTTTPAPTATKSTPQAQRTSNNVKEKSVRVGGYSYPALKYDGRFEKPSPDVLVDIANNEVINNRVERLHPANIPYLPNYKNPCWFEEVEANTAYSGNVYAYFKDRDHRIRPAFERFKATLQSRQKRDGNSWLLRCLPYFFLVGSPRCGTTDLYSKMILHPEIPHQIGKETVYWNRARYLASQVVGTRPVPSEFKIPLSIRHYVEWFDTPAEEIRTTFEKGNSELPQHKLIIGDFSPSYMYDFDSWRHVPANQNTSPNFIVADMIKSVNPKAKILFMLRNPIDRLLSDYLFWSPKNRKTPQEFHELVEANLKSFDTCRNQYTYRYCLHDRTTHLRQLPIRPRAGLYYAYMKEWFNVFPKNQTLTIRFEDYRDERETTMSKIFKFLGVQNMSSGWFSYVTSGKAKNQSQKSTFRGPAWNSTINLLKDFYEPWNEKLAELLEDDRFLWKS